MSSLGNEETLVELPIIEYLTDKLNYEFIHGQKLTSNLKQLGYLFRKS